jgi:hypothetical protein
MNFDAPDGAGTIKVLQKENPAKNDCGALSLFGRVRISYVQTNPR